MTAGLPGVAAMNDAILERLPNEALPKARELLGSRNIEQALTRLRRIAAIAEDGETVGGFSAAEAVALDKTLCVAIVDVVSHPPGSVEAFHSLGVWAAGAHYSSPIEIFTVNYDTLIEIGLEFEAVSYFDGFVGSLRGQFREDLVEVAVPDSARLLPATFVRLWKLHGSINWTFQERDGARSVIRIGAPVERGSTAAIYPSDEKYDDSRRVPFVVLMDRFRHALAMPESSTIVCGYSFSDQHLNDMLFDAAKRYPRSEIVVTCCEEIPEILAERAQVFRNILVLGSREAIIGGARGRWVDGATVPEIYEGDRLVLADFRYLARFLAKNRALESTSATP
jgi:hypothetical protein